MFPYLADSSLHPSILDTNDFHSIEDCIMDYLFWKHKLLLLLCTHQTLGSAMFPPVTGTECQGNAPTLCATSTYTQHILLVLLFAPNHFQTVNPLGNPLGNANRHTFLIM